MIDKVKKRLEETAVFLSEIVDKFLGTRTQLETEMHDLVLDLKGINSLITTLRLEAADIRKKMIKIKEFEVSMTKDAADYQCIVNKALQEIDDLHLPK